MLLVEVWIDVMWLAFGDEWRKVQWQYCVLDLSFPES